MIYRKILYFIAYALFVLLLALSLLAPLANAHGMHTPWSNLEGARIIGSRTMDRCSRIFYIDTNDNGRPDWIRIVTLCGSHGPHYMFDDTYSLFLREFGDYWKWEKND